MSAKAKRWTGRIKQAAGTLAGNEKWEREGRADRRSAEAEKRLTEARARVGTMIDNAADAVKTTIGTKGSRSRHR